MFAPLVGLILLNAEVLTAPVDATVYSPATLEDTVWVGGWPNRSVAVDYLTGIRSGRIPGDLVGPDRMWVVGRDDCPLITQVGHHINDPSIVRAPGHPERLYLYDTRLANVDAEGQRWSEHRIGFRSSIDGGCTWRDHGLIAPGWSPSALVQGDRVWIYVHDAQATVWRLQVINGWRVVARERVPDLQGLVNVDISVDGGGYRLVANAGLHQIVTSRSADGMTWSPPVVVLEAPEGWWLPTPHLDQAGRLLFAYGQAEGIGEISVHRWTIEWGDS